VESALKLNWLLWKKAPRVLGFYRFLKAEKYSVFGFEVCEN